MKNTLRGFFTLTLPSGLVLHDCCLHEKNGIRWVGPPANRYVDKSGAAQYKRIVDFVNRDVADRFRDEALLAFDREQGAGG